MFAVYLFIYSPSSLSLDPHTDVVPEVDAALEYDYRVDDQTLAAELPGKQTPVVHSDIAHFFPSHACIRTATAFVWSYSDA